VLNANRNQPRKRIDITLRGFALFAVDKPETVQLYLHMGSEDMGWNALQLAR
jgi:D-inositol-3-phosphate glycosyltransferase